MYSSAKKLPSVEVLKERFEIDPSTPSGLRWKVNPPRGWKKAGDVVGSKNGLGRYHTTVNGERFYNSRLIWKMVNGKDPDHVIDHIDNNPLNNNISNLRDVTQRENSLNRRDFKLSNNNNSKNK
jgi:hypothetical protein